MPRPADTPEKPIVAVGIKNVKVGEVGTAKIPRESKRSQPLPCRYDPHIVGCCRRLHAGAKHSDHVTTADESVGEGMNLVADADLAAGR